MISQQNILIDGMHCHVKDLHPIIGSSALESGSDSESSTQSARMITISSDPPQKQAALGLIYMNQMTLLKMCCPGRKSQLYYYKGA